MSVTRPRAQRAAPLRLTLLPGLCLLLAGCSCVTYRVLELDSRAKVEERQRFAVLATRLVEGDGFAEPVAAGEALAEHYRPQAGAGPWSVRPLADAPPELHDALAAARAVLQEKGYAPATAAEGAGAPDLVILVSVTRAGRDGALRRVSVDVGGPLDERFERSLASLDATLPEDGDCQATVVDLVRELVGALPEHAEPGADED